MPLGGVARARSSLVHQRQTYTSAAVSGQDVDASFGELVPHIGPPFDTEGAATEAETLSGRPQAVYVEVYDTGGGGHLLWLAYPNNCACV